MALLPASLYDAYRKPAAPTTGRSAENHPPLNASPGELRLWQKLHGELDKDKAADEARTHARNAGRRDVAPAPPANGIAKSGRRAGLRTSSAEAARSVSPTADAASRPTADAVKIRAELVDKAAALKTAVARVAGLEERLRATTEQRDAARADAEMASATVSELQTRLESAAKAEQAKVEALGARLSEVLAEWKAQQEEWAVHKAQLESERDAALGRPLNATPAALELAGGPPKPGHASSDEAEVYSEDEGHDEE